MVYKRISARLGQTVDLDVAFYHGGVPADPYAIRRVEIYKTQVLPHNLVATIFVADPRDAAYPLPLVQHTVDLPAGQCGTGPQTGSPVPGKYSLMYDIPPELQAPDVYFDVWHFHTVDPCDQGTAPADCDPDSPENAARLTSCCHRFWVYPDQWFCGDGLQTVRFGFEPLDQRFHQPELRPLEVGLMPLPLYDYNYNLVNPLIPFLRATITVETQHSEMLVDAAEMSIGVRQGSYRSNPWVLRYNLDTTKFLKGTYRYRVVLHLPDGTTRASKNFILTVD